MQYQRWPIRIRGLLPSNIGRLDTEFGGFCTSQGAKAAGIFTKTFAYRSRENKTMTRVLRFQIQIYQIFGANRDWVWSFQFDVAPIFKSHFSFVGFPPPHSFQTLPVLFRLLETVSLLSDEQTPGTLYKIYFQYAVALGKTALSLDCYSLILDSALNFSFSYRSRACLDPWGSTAAKRKRRKNRRRT